MKKDSYIYFDLDGILLPFREPGQGVTLKCMRFAVKHWKQNL
jgi:hypothetical protein